MPKFYSGEAEVHSGETGIDCKKHGARQRQNEDHSHTNSIIFTGNFHGGKPYLLFHLPTRLTFS